MAEGMMIEPLLIYAAIFLFILAVVVVIVMLIATAINLIKFNIKLRHREQAMETSNVFTTAKKAQLD